MKTRIALLFSALAIVSCAPVKRSVDSNFRDTAVAERHVAESRKEHTDTSTKGEWTGDEEVTTTRRDYDTEKPVDPATGTPPLKSETSQVRRKVEAAHVEQKIAQGAESQRDQTGRRDENSTAQVATFEKRGMNTLQRVILNIGFLAIGVGLVWGGLNIKNQIKTI